MTVSNCRECHHLRLLLGVLTLFWLTRRITAIITLNVCGCACSLNGVCQVSDSGWHIDMETRECHRVWTNFGKRHNSPEVFAKPSSQKTSAEASLSDATFDKASAKRNTSQQATSAKGCELSLEDLALTMFTCM